MIDNEKEKARLAIAAGDEEDDGIATVSVVTEGGYGSHNNGSYQLTEGQRQGTHRLQ
jgi:hypothetical protein